MRATDDGGRLERSSAGERIYDGLALLLLMWPATGGMFLMGSTRVWGYAPGLLASFLGSMLVLARPLVFPRTVRWRFPPGFGWLAALTVYVAAARTWAAVPHAAQWEALRWGCLLAALFSWVQLGGRAHRWKWLLGVLLLAVALTCLYALIQHVNGSRMVLWMERPEQYRMRASGTYLCPNHLANMIAMLVPLALLLTGLPEAGFPLRILSVYYLGVSAPVLYWTQSRSGWLGMVAGVGAAGLLLAWRKSRGWFLVALVAFPLLAGAAGLSAWAVLPAVRERMGAVLENPEKAGGIRMQMWRDTPAMIRERPVVGFGGGSFIWIYPPYQRNVKDHLTWDYLHNEYLQHLLEYGLAGLALAGLGLGACVWGLARAAVRGRSRAGSVLVAGAFGALAANLVHAVFDFNFHIFPNPHALVWILGVTWAVWQAEERGREASTGRRRQVRRAAAVAGAAACAAAAWLVLAAGLSYVWNLRAEMARTRLDWDQAGADYARAIRWDDGNWRPHLGLGNLRVTQALWYRDPDLEAEREGKRRLAAEAAEHFEAALERNACEMAAEFGLARALNASGDAEGALAHYRRAAGFQHRHIFYREQLGIQLRRLGREREALEVFRQNVADGIHTDVSRLNIRTLERRLAREEAEAAAGTSP